MTFQPPRAIYFDFDYCLYQSDSAATTIDQLFRQQAKMLPCFQANPEDDVIAFMWRNAPDVIVDHFKLTSEEQKAFLKFYEDLPVPPEAILYEDSFETLSRLEGQNVRLFLVTKGELAFQTRKIDHFGLRQFFVEVHVVGYKGAHFATKRAAFEDIASRHNHTATSTIVIGDGHEELTAGIEMGFTSVQTLRPGVQKVNAAHHHITTLHDLLPILGL